MMSKWQTEKNTHAHMSRRSLRSSVSEVIARPLSTLALSQHSPRTRRWTGVRSDSSLSRSSAAASSWAWSSAAAADASSPAVRPRVARHAGLSQSRLRLLLVLRRSRSNTQQHPAGWVLPCLRRCVRQSRGRIAPAASCAEGGAPSSAAAVHPLLRLA